MAWHPLAWQPKTKSQSLALLMAIFAFIGLLVWYAHSHPVPQLPPLQGLASLIGPYVLDGLAVILGLVLLTGVALGGLYALVRVVKWVVRFVKWAWTD